MNTRQAFPVKLAETDGGVEVFGYELGDVEQALSLFEAMRAEWASRAPQVEDQIEAVLRRAGAPIVPPSSVLQAERRAAKKDALLATPAYTYRTLAQVRGASESTTRTWISRRAAKGQVVTVTDGGQIVIPAFQFDEDGNLRTELTGTIAVLTEAGITGWAAWTWLTEPTGLLSGGIPEQVAAESSERSAKAAQRFAAPQYF